MAAAEGLDFLSLLAGAAGVQPTRPARILATVAQPSPKPYSGNVGNWYSPAVIEGADSQVGQQGWVGCMGEYMGEPELTSASPKP